MDYLPLFLSLRGRPVLLVGGGAIALRKARLLDRAGAVLTVVCPDIDPELETLLGAGEGQWVSRRYDEADLDGPELVVVATADGELNQRVAAAASARKLPVNVVDQPELCSFVFPSIVDRSPLIVAVGSAGNSPVLARLVRARIEALLPAAYGRLAMFLGGFRTKVRSVLSDESHRRRFWERLVEGPVAEMVLAGREEAAAERVEELLSESEHAKAEGEVFLVGAGPGDPDLLTFKAARILQTADVVLYDRLVAPEVLEVARRDADRVYVGKRRSHHAMAQENINELLLKLALEGKRVVRLKGGDPFIFGRGGEEIELLAQRGIPFQVVPGITAASGCASYAGIPLTHRDYAQSVRFVTGQLVNDTVDLPWQQLAAPGQTLVFYMGLKGLPTICRELCAHGRDPGTPAALVEQGTTRNQRSLVGTLSNMEELTSEQVVHAPTLLIVGEVVALHSALAWYGEAATPGSWPPDASVV